MAKILIVDDDAVLGLNISDFLQSSGHKCDISCDADEADGMLEKFQYDLVILDWELPDGTGINILKKFRQRGGITPILMLTGRASIEDKEAGLEAGADDYLTKPFHMKELAARARALMRRPAVLPNDELKIANLVMKPGERLVLLNNEEIKLRPIEFAVLEFLMRNPGKLFKPEKIIDRVWESTTEVSVHAVYSCIKRLKQSLDRGNEESILKNVPGQGYGIIDK